MKCSVIVACYNNPDLIIETLASIENQTYKDWELVLVDDCSTDNTLDVLQQYMKSSQLKDKYKLIHLPKNNGVSFAKGAGIQNSNGDIIVVCDHDDTLAPTALEEVVKVHQQYPNASMVYTQHYNCDAYLNPVEIEPCSDQVIYSDILEDKIGHLLTYKRSHYDLTPGYDPFFKIADDKDIIYKLEEVGDAIFVKKPLYNFRISSRGASQGYRNFNLSRAEKMIAAKNALARRNKSGIKQIASEAFNKFLSDHYLLQAEGYILMDEPLNTSFITSLLKAYYYAPNANLIRKLKATLLLSRIKRKIKNLFR